MQEFYFLYSGNYIWERKEYRFLIGCMKMTEEEDYTEEALRNRKNENALNNRLGFPFHQKKAQPIKMLKSLNETNFQEAKMSIKYGRKRQKKKKRKTEK